MEPMATRPVVAAHVGSVRSASVGPSASLLAMSVVGRDTSLSIPDSSFALPVSRSGRDFSLDAVFAEGPLLSPRSEDFDFELSWTIVQRKKDSPNL